MSIRQQAKVIWQQAKDNLDILKAIGVFFMTTFGMFHLPSALERAKLRQSIHESIMSSVESLTSRDNISKRDVAISGLSFLLNSKALENERGKELVNSICCAILGDYKYSGDAKGVMRILKENGMPLEKHAHKLSRCTLVIDKIDVKGGIDSERKCDFMENIKVRRENLMQMSQQIEASLVHYEKVVYILKNRTKMEYGDEESALIVELRNRISKLLRGKISVVHIDDTPMWISQYEVRFYHDEDRAFAVRLRWNIEELIKCGARGGAGCCKLSDYSLYIQGKMLPKGVVEVAVPLPSPAKEHAGFYTARLH